MPKSLPKKSPKDGLSCLIDEIKEFDISKESLPKELDELSDPGDLDDTDDILSNYSHNEFKECKDVLFYYKLTGKCVEFIKNNNTSSLSAKDKKNLFILINKIYAKMIIYQHHVVLNPLDDTYKDDDEKLRENIMKLQRFVNKLIDTTFLIRKKKNLVKSDLVVFFNNTYKLFSIIYDLIKL